MFCVCRETRRRQITYMIWAKYWVIPKKKSFSFITYIHVHLHYNCLILCVSKYCRCCSYSIRSSGHDHWELYSEETQIKMSWYTTPVYYLVSAQSSWLCNLLSEMWNCGFCRRQFTIHKYKHVSLTKCETLTVLNYLLFRANVFVFFEITTNVLVSSFCFIWIPF